MSTNLKVQSKYRMGYFATLQGEIERFKMKMSEIIRGMNGPTDLEKVVYEHSIECMKEINSVNYLVASLRNEGPARAIIMIDSKGNPIDILNGKDLDNNEAYNILIDNLKNN